MKLELAPNITFQPNEIFVIKDLFEKIIKRCKATNLKFLKLGLCLYENICDKQELILTSEEIFTQHDLENKQLKEENEKLRKEKNEQLRKENEQLRKNNAVKDATIKESIKKPIEIKSLKEDKNTADYYPNWFDRNKFEETLAILRATNLITRVK